MPIGSFLYNMFSGDGHAQNVAAQAQAQGQASAVQAQNAGVQGLANTRNIGMQAQAINAAMGNNQAFNINYPFVFNQDQYFIPYGERQAPPPLRPRHIDSFEAIHQLSNSWAMEGMQVHEMIVSKDTFAKLYLHVGGARVHLRGELPTRIPISLTINTAIGPIVITCEKNKNESFNLDAYMETVE